SPHEPTDHRRSRRQRVARPSYPAARFRWHRELENGPIRCAGLSPKSSDKRLDDGTTNRKPHADPFFLSGEEGAEDLLCRLGIQARAAVMHGDENFAAGPQLRTDAQN